MVVRMAISLHRPLVTVGSVYRGEAALVALLYGCVVSGTPWHSLGTCELSLTVPGGATLFVVLNTRSVYEPLDGHTNRPDFTTGDYRLRAFLPAYASSYRGEFPRHASLRGLHTLRYNSSRSFLPEP